MSRVLLVCPEPLGHKQPAGIGVRFLEMDRVLRGDGHEVTILSPDGSLTPDSIRSATATADVAVVQGHIANDLFAHGRSLPTVVDLYDPFIVENLHYYRERGAEVFTHDHATLINSLVHGDFFLCASQAQRLFYIGALLATGRFNPAIFEDEPRLESLIAIAPFGVQAPRARAVSPAHDILFGGVYDWYDPILAIEAAAIARRSVPDLTLMFTRHPNPGITPQGKAAAAIEHVRLKGYESFVRFESWIPYAHRGEFFDRFSIALLTFPQSVETDLAMRTRIYDYLWGGLPVITSSAPGTDEIIERYGAGTVVRSGDADEFAKKIVELLTQEQRRQSMIEGADRFVRGHQWEETLAPLREFCRHPRVESTKDAFAIRLEVPSRSRSLLDRLNLGRRKAR
jgi:glycosyltransferase involved in cell wall biosynthesis